MARPPPRSTLFPYTTLFRSVAGSTGALANTRPPAKTAFTGCSKRCRCWPFNRRCGPGRKCAWERRTATWWSWTAKPCGASRGTQLVGAINAQSGRRLGVEAVASKSNEIPAGQTLLDRLELDGTIALMDALHTQVQTAHTIVQEGGGHFVLFAKGNQSHLLDQAKHFLPEDFSPELLQVERGHGRIEWRGIKVLAVTPAQMGFPHVLQLARIDRIRELKRGKQEVETVWVITSFISE